MTSKYDAARRLAQMPEHAPERCLVIDHTWAAWGPFVPELQVDWAVDFIFTEPAVPEPVKAWRRRGCRQCGCEQVENYDGTERKVVADPSGIEARINRPKVATNV